MTTRHVRAMKTMKILSKVLPAAAAIAAGAAVWAYFGTKTTNRHDYEQVGEIPPPSGYQRMEPEDAAYAAYLRSLPLKPKGSKVRLFTGGEARLQSLAYAVVDVPLLSNDEQCADVCMRLRAEYLFHAKRYGRIRFRDVNGRTLSYTGGSSRKAFERYLRKVYGVASTFSLKNGTKRRELKDIRPGDMFVYAAGDHDLERKMNSKYGHAVMVVDVAVDRQGNKAVLLAEGNTPARDIHVLRNWWNPVASPWFRLDDDAEILIFDCFYYKGDELRHF